MWSQYTFHGALLEVGLHFALHSICCRPLMHRMHGAVQRLLGLCVLFQHIWQCHRRLSDVLLLKISMSASSSSIELPPPRRRLKQESTSTGRCFSMSRFSSATRATRMLLPRTSTPVANARLLKSLLYVGPRQWTKTSSIMRILMCRVDS